MSPHHLLRWLPVALYAVEDGVNATELVLFPVPLGGGVLPPPGESAAGGCTSSSQQNSAEIQGERLYGDRIVIGSDSCIDDAVKLLTWYAVETRALILDASRYSVFAVLGATMTHDGCDGAASKGLVQGLVVANLALYRARGADFSRIY